MARNLARPLAAIRGSSDSESSLAALSSISDSNSADSARMVTPSSVTDIKPPSTASRRSSSPSRSTRTMASSTNWATNGIWRARIPISPTVVRVNRNVASPDQIFRSTATISTFNSAMPHHLSTHWILELGAKALGLLGQVVQATDQEEGLLGHVVELPLAQAVERLDGFLQRHRRTRLAGELFGRHHVLREEPLDAPGPVDQLLVLFRQLVDTEDRNDVLKVLVALQDTDDFLRHPVVLVSDDTGVENGRARRQRVYCREDAFGEHRTRQLSGGVQVRERRRRSRVGVVVGRHVDRLHRRNRPPPR